MNTTIRDFANEAFFDPQEARSYWGRFSALLGIAAIIATVGLYRNSGAVVIAAMLLAPLMTPILGIAKALVLGWIPRMMYLLAVVLVASAATIGLSYVIMAIADAPQGMLVPSEVQARTDPGLEELMIALAAGIAGAYVEMRRQEVSLLPGVAIGVSLVPPLAAAGILLYFGNTGGAWEATFLFLTNLAAIVLSACGVFLVLGIRPDIRAKGHVTKVGLSTFITFGIVVFLAFELAQVTIDRFREARDEEAVVTAVRQWAGDEPVEIQRVDVLKETVTRTVELWLLVDVPIDFGREIMAPEDMIPLGLRERDLKDYLRRVLGPDTDVQFRLQFRYAGVFDLRTGEQVGVTVPAEGQ
ncbi:MAG: DUF389 domain-containing protein [Arenicellales bacterium]|nr:DUF389 domain-containing protein [Arenicellales bacterium]